MLMLLLLILGAIDAWSKDHEYDQDQEQEGAKAAAAASRLQWQPDAAARRPYQLAMLPKEN